MFSIATTPAKQSVSETISVLSGRLNSGTLLEDRRAAILGLRSFAKAYPATVASGALRSLIGSLSKDGEDVDTVKVVLETLLMLFNADKDSPEASEEIFLWLADEFTQRQENITLLLDFLELPEFYSRLYSLQLLAAILLARTERTEECIFTAPLGISRLVAVLDDQREAIRNEAITLLIYLTPSSIDVQKLVAFENAFDRLFTIITSDGALSEGSRTVEDCLILLANLLRRNSSNQSLFRESGGILRLSGLLETGLLVQTADEDDVASWAQTQRNRNIFALLALVRLLLLDGAHGTPQNQTALWRHGFLFHALQLAFNIAAQTPIRAEALVTCADIIRGNSSLQESFAQLQVPSPTNPERPEAPPQTNGHAITVFVIDGLLDLTLAASSLDTFDVRWAACDCLKAYFHKHVDIRLHFLKRAIEGFRGGLDETANVLTVLLRPKDDDAVTNPYRTWFAAIIVLHLLFDNPEAKRVAMEITEGDADSGEEVVTGIQIITAHLVSALNREQDSRVVIGYLILLLCWMFEDLEAINDFLSEGSNVQSLIQAVIRPVPADDIVQGLCAMLLGEVYEFSTKDSPISRASLHSILLSRMGRDRYVDKLDKLRSHTFMRDFEVLPQKLDPQTGMLPNVFFDATFVDFFKDNYSRMTRCLDREPGLEISIITNGVQRGISRDLVDSLRSEMDERTQALQRIEAAMAEVQAQLAQERADHQKARGEASSNLRKATIDIEKLEQKHEDVLEGLRRESASLLEKQKKEAGQVKDALLSEIENLRRQQAVLQDDHRRQLEYVKKSREGELDKLRRNNAATLGEQQKQFEQRERTATLEADKARRRAEADAADLRATISRLEADLMKANKSKTQELDTLRKEHAATLKQKQEQHKTELLGQGRVKDEAQARADKLHAELQTTRDELQKSRMALSEAEETKKSTQAELDDLLMVFADLEEKAAKYKSRLRTKGEEVSDGEDDENEDDEDEDEDASDDEANESSAISGKKDERQKV